MYLNEYRNTSILITGGAGAIGSQLVQTLISANPKIIIILDNLSSGYLWNLPKSDKILFIEGDIIDDVILRRVFNENPDYVFHLAAFFANQNSVDYPQLDLKTNGSGTLKLLEYAKLYGNLKRFVYASSGCSLYPSDAPMPFTEDLVTTYLSTPYQITKMLGELYCNYYWKVHDLPICKARFFNSFGPGEVPGQYRNVIPNFLFWAMNGKPLPITGTGEETRDFTYVQDIVNGLIAMGIEQKAIGEEINLAAGKEIKIIDMANQINKITNNQSGLIYKERRNWDTKSRLLASNEKAKNILKFNSSKSFEEGLTEAHLWFKKNWDKINESADFKIGMSSAVR